MWPEITLLSITEESIIYENANTVHLKFNCLQTSLKSLFSVYVLWQPGITPKSSHMDACLRPLGALGSLLASSFNATC